MTIELLDPADADNFRMTKDYGRWYIDPLPACAIAPATDQQWPSCSAVKKASEKDWSFLVAPRIAALPKAELERIAGLDRQQRLDTIKSHENRAKNIAFGRGSIIHLWKEDMLAGREPREITEGWLSNNRYPADAYREAQLYLPAIIDFFDVYQPEPVVVEYVTIHRHLNGHGYGATPDALVKIEGEIVAVDWKTRSAGSNHAAYAEELAQVACGARAEYMIVRDGGEARRALLPEVKGGYVVSIKTDGARLYPLDLDKGWAHWCRLHEWWVARQTEKDGIGRVLPARRKSAAPVPSTVEQPATVAVEDAATVAKSTLGPTFAPQGAKVKVDSPSLRETLLARFAALTPDQKGEFKARRIPKNDWAAIERTLDEIEHPPSVREIVLALTHKDGAHSILKAAQTAINPRPTEGHHIDESDFAPMAAAYEQLPDAAKKWCARLLAESREAGVPFHRANAPTMRRYELYRGLIHLAQWLGDDERGVA